MEKSYDSLPAQAYLLGGPSFLSRWSRHRAEQKAAVGDELGAGREAGLVGGDEQHQPRDLFRLGDARNRKLPYRGRYRLGVWFGHRRADGAWVDGS